MKIHFFIEFRNLLIKYLLNFSEVEEKKIY